MIGRKGRRSQGFTLIELLVVIAILGVLAAMLLPVLGRATERARVSKVRQELKSLQHAVEAFALEHEGYPDAEAAGWTADYPVYLAQLVEANEITYAQAKKFLDPFSDPSLEDTKRYYRYYVAKKDKWTSAGGEKFPQNDSYALFSVGPDEDAFTFVDNSGDVDPSLIQFVFDPNSLDMNDDGINDFDYNEAPYRWLPPDPKTGFSGSPDWLKPYNSQRLPNSPENAKVKSILTGLDPNRADGIILLTGP